jgi:hypothetical protein
MSLIPPNLGKEIRDKFKTARNETSKYIYLYGTPDKEDCPNCLALPDGSSSGTYDSTFTTPVVIFGETITPTSFTRGRCPICSGKGNLEQESKQGIKAIIRWNPSGDGDLDITAAGLEGYNIVLVKADRKYYEKIRDCNKAEIEGIECVLLSPPTIRFVGSIDVSVIAYFSSKDVGHSIRE